TRPRAVLRAEAIATYLRNRRGERELARMSDYELHDLAITRGDIHQVAWQQGRMRTCRVAKFVLTPFQAGSIPASAQTLEARYPEPRLASLPCAIHRSQGRQFRTACRGSCT